MKKINDFYRFLVIGENDLETEHIKYLLKEKFENCRIVSRELVIDSMTILDSRSFDLVLLNIDTKDFNKDTSISHIRTMSPDMPVIITASPERKFDAASMVSKGANNYYISDLKYSRIFKVVIGTELKNSNNLDLFKKHIATKCLEKYDKAKSNIVSFSDLQKGQDTLRAD